MRVVFNRGRQWLEVHLDLVSPQTFQRRGGGRWGYWQDAEERQERRGCFGEMHLVASRVRPDVVAHELTHVVASWLNGVPITPRNEERVARLMDELTRGFWREYRKGSGADGL